MEDQHAFEEPTRDDLTDSSSRKRAAGRSSMRDELFELFRNTEISRPAPQSACEPPRRNQDSEPPAQPVAPQPSPFLRRLLQRSALPAVVVPSGLVSLDDHLEGGFGPGLHLIFSEHGPHGTGILDSLAWESVSTHRPILYYALEKGGLETWGRFVVTLGHVLGEPVVSAETLKARSLDKAELEAITQLDLGLQSAVLPYLSLVDTIPVYSDVLGVFIDDVRERARVARARHGHSPLILIDDLERLTLLTRTRPLPYLLSRMNDALMADGLAGVTAAVTTLPSPGSSGRLPSQMVAYLTTSSLGSGAPLQVVDLDVRVNRRSGWTGTIPLLLDCESGLFTDPSAGDYELI